MNSRIAAVAAVLVASATLALAHGPHDHAGHAHGPAAYGEPGDAGKPAREVVVVMKEADGKMLFEPSVITVAAGEQIRFRFDNVGELDHEFLLGTAAEIEEHADMMKAMPDMKHEDANSRQVKAKAKGDLVWKFTTAGEFDFACLIPGHREAGMTGKIVVK